MVRARSLLGPGRRAAASLRLDRSAVVNPLAEHRQRADERAAEAGATFGGEAFRFSHHPDGSRPWRPDSITGRFARLCRKAGLEHVRFHDLRHFVATRLLAAGVDLRTVASQPGHSKAGTTLNVYAAFVPDADHHAADVMARLVTAANPGANGPGDTSGPVNPTANPLDRG
jgi:integrase